MPQTGPDLVGAGYPISNALAVLSGGVGNTSQPNVPARSNLEWFGISSAAAAGIATTGIVNVVPVPALPGQVVTGVKILVGATAASAPTHQFAAIYAGTGSAPALVGQSTDAGSAAVAANGFYTWTFGTPITLSSSNAINGFVYAAFSLTATTMPNAVTVTGPAATGYATPTGAGAGAMPAFLAASFGSSVAGTAPASITSTTNVTAVPLVWLV